MFLKRKELGNVIYGYQVDQITEGDNSIALEAIEAATEEIKSYLSGNHKKEWLDGRLKYDVDAIFNATGDDRNPLILAHTKTIAKWFIVELCNADVIYEHAKERYDRSISWLTKLAEGDVTLTSLPLEILDETETTKEPFAYGSRTKFNHE